MRRIFNIALPLAIFIFGCSKYHRGDMYTSLVSEDSLEYIIFSKGTGHKISDIALQKKTELEFKGSECKIRYLTDSAQLEDEKGLLLLNTKLPDKEKDILTEGFFGTFTTKQTVSILLVSVSDLDRFFNKTPEIQKKDRPF